MKLEFFDKILRLVLKSNNDKNRYEASIDSKEKSGQLILKSKFDKKKMEKKFSQNKNGLNQIGVAREGFGPNIFKIMD